jgi:hypothetical protein
MLDLRTIAKALGGEVSGRQVLCPGPGHSPRDRSLAIMLAVTAPDGFVVNSFCDDDWRVCKDHVRSLLGITRETPLPRQRALIIKHDEDQAKRHRAEHLWSCRAPVGNTVVETYLREARGYHGAVPATIGYLEPSAYPWPAMIAAFGAAAELEPGVLNPPSDIRGIHLTFLEHDGSGKAAIGRPKIMLGPSSGFPIVVAPPNDLLGLVVTEGIEDALSVCSATDLGVWAAGSAGRMPAVAPVVPRYVETVTICAHSDVSGQRGACGLANALLSRGIEILIEGLD